MENQSLISMAGRLCGEIFSAGIPTAAVGINTAWFFSEERPPAEPQVSQGRASDLFWSFLPHPQLVARAAAVGGTGRVDRLAADGPALTACTGIGRGCGALFPKRLPRTPSPEHPIGEVEGRGR